MTIYGWDASHHDWPRGPMDIAAAVRDGIAFMTHKIGEARTVTDDKFAAWYQRARGVVPLLGAYYVNHPGDQHFQADRMLSMLDSKAPGWRDGPFVLQVDAEKFDYMDRAPSPTEVRAFCDRLVARTGGAFTPIVYAPRWLYGDSLRGLPYPLWASAYGSNPAVNYRQAYPADTSSRWDAYSGQTPAILQYGSRTTIGRQPNCDANAFRGSLDELRTLVTGGIEMERTEFIEHIKDPAVQSWIGEAVKTKFVAGTNAGSLWAGAAGGVAELRTEMRETLAAVLAAVRDGDDSETILARIDARAAEQLTAVQAMRGELLAELGPALVAALREEVEDGMPAEQLDAAMERALSRVRVTLNAAIPTE
jgi:hypothetical protein